MAYDKVSWEWWQLVTAMHGRGDCLLCCEFLSEVTAALLFVVVFRFCSITNRRCDGIWTTHLLGSIALICKHCGFEITSHWHCMVPMLANPAVLGLLGNPWYCFYSLLLNYFHTITSILLGASHLTCCVRILWIQFHFFWFSLKVCSQEVRNFHYWILSCQMEGHGAIYGFVLQTDGWIVLGPLAPCSK